VCQQQAWKGIFDSSRCQLFGSERQEELLVLVENSRLVKHFQFLFNDFSDLVFFIAVTTQIKLNKTYEYISQK
jgi:hypothetical protein